MARVPVADRALLYHFTHFANLQSIFRVGRLVADRTAEASGLCEDVGDAAIKARRRTRTVPGHRDVVADFVPFYFAPRSPMMFRIACDHRDAIPGRYGDGDDPLVYLVTSVDRVVEAGCRWLATDGNAAAAISTFTDQVEELTELVDWALMKDEHWSDTNEDRDRQRRRMAEFLVHGHLPTTSLAGCAVRTEQRREQVTSLLAGTAHAGLFVGVRPGWYYGYTRAGGQR